MFSHNVIDAENAISIASCRTEEQARQLCRNLNLKNPGRGFFVTEYVERSDPRWQEHRNEVLRLAEMIDKRMKRGY